MRPYTTEINFKLQISNFKLREETLQYKSQISNYGHKALHYQFQISNYGDKPLHYKSKIKNFKLRKETHK